jgi:hypothetical protein
VGLGRDSQRPHERHLPPQGDLDVGSSGQLEDRAATLPETQVTPTRSISGDAHAYSNASASSMPVSQSMR